MENLDIHNAITTLNTIYFFECARKQGYSPKLLEDILMHSFNLTREKAIQNNIQCSSVLPPGGK